MTCMASDQVPADGLGVYSTFFGHECYSFSLAPKLARKSNKKFLCHIYPMKTVLAIL